MKQILLSAFLGLLFCGVSHAQTFQDTTFTDPVFISFAPDFVTFQNCRFVGITGTALTIEGSGALISNCSFENIEGTAVYAFLSEVYLVEDTIQNVLGTGVLGELGAVILIGTQISKVSETAVLFRDTEVAEVTDCTIADVGAGAICTGAGDAAEMVVQNSTFHRIHGLPGQEGTGDAIQADALLFIRVVDCTIDSCLGAGIRLGQAASATTLDGVDLQRNRISRTNLDGIIGQENVSNAIIQNNEISYPGFLGGTPALAEHCIQWVGPNARIEGNVLHHAQDPGCGTPNCGGSGIWIKSSASITRNTIHHCAGNGIQFSNEDQQTTGKLLIFNNIIHDITGSPIAYLGGISAQSEPEETWIRNNTLHATFEGAPLPLGLLLVASNLNPVSAQGNILLYEGLSDTTGYIQLINSFNFTENLNLKASGNLGFVDFVGRDFHLASENSPAHNMLPLNFGLPNDDFDGDLRLGLRDAGADELAMAEVICGCNNCPNTVPDLFYGDFTFAVLTAENNDLATSTQGVCGVRIEFEHQYIGDVKMELIAPSGQAVQLVGPNGFFGSTDQTTWNIGFVPCGFPASPDPGFSAIWNSNQNWGEAATYTGIYYPSGGCLEDFNQGTVTGEWTLRAYDNQVNDIGTVKGFEVMFCDLSGISCFVCNEPPTALFAPNLVGNWGVVLNNQTTGAASEFQVDYGDGQTASGSFFSFFHEYENAGTYLVRLIATNDCGVDTFSQMVQISGALPQAFAYAEPESGCVPLEIQTVVISSDHVDTWHWLFPGGAPAESFDMAPSVTYAQPGAYPVTLLVTNEVGTNTLTDLFTVDVQPDLSNANFGVQVLGDSIICSYDASNTTTFYWSLDGGPASGNDISPFVFEVNNSGNYTVGLQLFGSCDTILLTKEVSVMIVATKDLEQKGWQFAIAPNPNEGQFSLGIEAMESLPANLLVLNALGKEVSRQQIALQKGTFQYSLDLKELPSGIYVLQVQTAQGNASLRLVIR